MRHFPLFLDLAGRDVAVIGGGEVALRKVLALLEAGARVTVVAPTLHGQLQAHVAAGAIHHAGEALPADAAAVGSRPWFLASWFLVAATDDAAVNAAVAAAATAARKFVNVVDDAPLCTAIVPAIIDRSPLLVAVSSGGTAPMLARRVRREVEQLLDQGLGTLAKFLERWRARVKAAVAAPSRRREMYDQWMDGDVAALVRAGRETDADAAMATALAAGGGVAAAAGRVTLVGAGPGGAGLLTLDGLRALQVADVVLVDRLVSPEVRALARRDALQVEVGKEGGGHAVTQDEIHALMLEHARAGRHVVRLKGGDPFIFGRGGEEAQFLRGHGIPYAIVPGITAALAAGAYAGIPLTHRDHARSLRLATAHCRGSADETDWDSLAAEQGTLVLYMGIKQASRVQRELLLRGRRAETPVAVVENAGRVEQRVVCSTLGTLAEAVRVEAVQSPALLLVGEVTALARELHWFGAPPVTVGKPADRRANGVLPVAASGHAQAAAAP